MIDFLTLNWQSSGATITNCRVDNRFVFTMLQIFVCYKNKWKEIGFVALYTCASFLITFDWKGFANFLMRYNITEFDFHENKSHGKCCAFRLLLRLHLWRFANQVYEVLLAHHMPSHLNNEVFIIWCRYQSSSIDLNLHTQKLIYIIRVGQCCMVDLDLRMTKQLACKIPIWNLT